MLYVRDIDPGSHGAVRNRFGEEIVSKVTQRASKADCLRRLPTSGNKRIRMRPDRRRHRRTRRANANVRRTDDSARRVGHRGDRRSIVFGDGPATVWRWFPTGRFHSPSVVYRRRCRADTAPPDGTYPPERSHRPNARLTVRRSSRPGDLRNRGGERSGPSGAHTPILSDDSHSPSADGRPTRQRSRRRSGSALALRIPIPEPGTRRTRRSTVPLRIHVT